MKVRLEVTYLKCYNFICNRKESANMKKNDDYIPQFESAMSCENQLQPGVCILCNKLSDYLNGDGLCYQCATDMEICKKHRTSN